MSWDKDDVDVMAAPAMLTTSQEARIVTTLEKVILSFVIFARYRRSQEKSANHVIFKKIIIVHNLNIQLRII